MRTVVPVDALSNASLFGSFGPFPPGLLKDPPRYLVVSLGGTATAFPEFRASFGLRSARTRAQLDADELVSVSAITLAMDFSTVGFQTVLIPIDGNLAAGGYVNFELESTNAMDSFTGFVGIR
jgi:hypothetical protein